MRALCRIFVVPSLSVCFTRCHASRIVGSRKVVISHLFSDRPLIQRQLGRPLIQCLLEPDFFSQHSLSCSGPGHVMVWLCWGAQVHPCGSEPRRSWRAIKSVSLTMMPEYASAALDPYLVGDIQQLQMSSKGQHGLCFASTSTLPLLLVYWSASSGHYCPPDVQTPDLHCSTRQYTTRLVSLFIIFRDHCETPDRQTTQHSSHYQLASTHIYSHFSHAQLPTGTNCDVNSI